MSLQSSHQSRIWTVFSIMGILLHLLSRGNITLSSYLFSINQPSAFNPPSDHILLQPPTHNITSQRPVREKGTELRVCYLNAYSLRAHIEQLRLFLAMKPLMHVIAVVETWLGPSIEDALVALDNYVILRRDRNTQGGGVALFVHKSL